MSNLHTKLKRSFPLSWIFFPSYLLSVPPWKNDYMLNCSSLSPVTTINNDHSLTLRIKLGWCNNLSPVAKNIIHVVYPFCTRPQFAVKNCIRMSINKCILEHPKTNQHIFYPEARQQASLPISRGSTVTPNFWFSVFHAFAQTCYLQTYFNQPPQAQ